MLPSNLRKSLTQDLVDPGAGSLAEHTAVRLPSKEFKPQSMASAWAAVYGALFCVLDLRSLRCIVHTGLAWRLLRSRESALNSTDFQCEMCLMLCLEGD